MFHEIFFFQDEEEGGDSEEWGMNDPPYLILARLAEIWLSDQTKQERNPQKAGDLYNQAAEVAMAHMKVSVLRYLPENGLKCVILHRRAN